MRQERSPQQSQVQTQQHSQQYTAEAQPYRSQLSTRYVPEFLLTLDQLGLTGLDCQPSQETPP